MIWLQQQRYHYSYCIQKTFGIQSRCGMGNHNGNKRNGSHRANNVVITHEELKNFNSLWRCAHSFAFECIWSSSHIHIALHTFQQFVVLYIRCTAWSAANRKLIELFFSLRLIKFFGWNWVVWKWNFFVLVFCSLIDLEYLDLDTPYGARTRAKCRRRKKSLPLRSIHVQLD